MLLQFLLGIHYSVIFRAVKNKKNDLPTRKKGQFTLTENEEEAIVHALELASEYGQPLEAMDLQIIIRMYLNDIQKTVKKFCNNTPDLSTYSPYLHFLLP